MANTRAARVMAVRYFIDILYIISLYKSSLEMLGVVAIKKIVVRL
jgi:hypothetical protein